MLITKVEIGSPAYLGGLRAGDAILEINGTPFTHLHHEEAVKKCTAILKAEKFCSMTIRSPETGTTMKYNSFDESQLMSQREEDLYIPVPHHESAAAAAGKFLINSIKFNAFNYFFLQPQPIRDQFILHHHSKSVACGSIVMVVQCHRRTNIVTGGLTKWIEFDALSFSLSRVSR